MKLCHGNFNKRLNESKTMTTWKSNKADNNNVNRGTSNINKYNNDNDNDNNTLKLTASQRKKKPQFD